MKFDTEVLAHALRRNEGRPSVKRWSKPLAEWSQAELDAVTDDQPLKTVLAVEANAEGRKT